MIGRMTMSKKLSVSEIGVFRFWAGVFLGIGFTIMLYLLISGTRDFVPWICSHHNHRSKVRRHEYRFCMI